MEESKYVEQLRAVFDSCDGDSQGLLNGDELRLLCSKLQLDAQANHLIQSLLHDDKSKVNFEEFKEGFISLLADSVQDVSEDEQADSLEEASAAMLVYGNKSYGRHTRLLSSPSSDDNLQGSPSSPEHLKDGDHPKLSQRKRAREGSDSSEDDVIVTLQREIVPEDGASVAADSAGVPDEDDLLHNIWQVLGVGQDGYLDESQLRKVCQHIGMENTSEQVIAQLFDKLDVDQGGKISVTEFLDLLETGHTLLHTQELPAAPSPVVEERRNTSNNSSQDTELRLFPEIDPTNTGYATADRVIALWDSLDIPRGRHILRDLGINTSCQVSLQELTDLLDESLHASATTVLSQVALASLRHSVQYLTSSLDQVLGERNKLRADLDDANMHASLLAQEVDDHQARVEKQTQTRIRTLEKNYQDQLRTVQEALKSEQESNHMHVTKLKQQMEEGVRSSRLEEAHLREEINAMEEDYTRLERESKDMADKMADTRKLLIHQQKELEDLTDLRHKVAELESGCDLHLNQHYKTVLAELQGCKSDNQRLKDKNDELETEVEGLKLQVNSLQLTSARPTSNKPQRAASWLSDYNKSCVRRIPVKPSSPSPDENSEDDRPRITRLRRKLVHTSSYEGSGTEVTSLPVKFPASRQASTSSSQISESPCSDVTRVNVVNTGSTCSDDTRVNKWLNDVLKEKEGEIAQLKEKLRETGEENVKLPSWELKKILNHLRKTIESERMAIMEDRGVNTEMREEQQSADNRQVHVFPLKLINGNFPPPPQDNRNKNSSYASLSPDNSSFLPPPPPSSGEEAVEQRWKAALHIAQQRHDSEKQRLQQSVLELKNKFYLLKEEFEDYAKKNTGSDKKDQSTDCGDWSADYKRDQATACDWSGDKKRDKADWTVDGKRDQATTCDWSCSCNCSSCSSRDDDVIGKLTNDCHKLQELKYSLEEDCAILELEKEKLLQDAGKEVTSGGDSVHGDHARCQQRYGLLEQSLVQQIHKSFTWYKKIEKEHSEEVERMHALLADSRVLVNKQGSTLLQQLEKTSQCNVLVKDLYVDNCHLTAALLNGRPQRSKTVRYYQECSAVDL